MTDTNGDWEQDQAETFDEDNMSLDEEGGPNAELRTFEEMPDVEDLTQAAGDADDDDALIAEDLDDEEIIELEADADNGEFDDAALEDDQNLAVRSTMGLSRPGHDEVELAAGGDMSQVGNSPASRFESSRLSDEDLEDLGYAKDGKAT
ncbi:hypothetical protein [Caulobacter sp. NIBR2454]|uniref:hypothetical protein n=1 Tax=Caulobacter sp. NIBR2454 TaxID=3015996 RepID=UPI0022B73A92|nr:hypothetical protein [Caulobacter sp. NIBR2454]